MNAKKRAALEAAGFRLGDAEDFLDLNDEERALVELRVRLSRAVRQLREQESLTQQQLAARIRSSQSRVAKIEAADRGISLDLLFRSFFAVGGQVDPAALVRFGPSRTSKPAGKRSGAAGRRTSPRTSSGHTGRVATGVGVHS